MSASPHTQAAAERGQQVLQAFRGGDNRAGIALHPLELALVIVASLQLCFLPWAFGGMVLWAQLTALALSVIALTVAAWRRVYDEPYTREGRQVLPMLPRLWRFPVFWLGLGFFAFIAVQGLNPSHVRMSDERGWWMQPVGHIRWLPSGMGTTFDHMNAWRVLVILGSAWLLVCALWIGLTRRTAVMAIMTALVVNGTVLALIGILQKATGAREVLWLFKVRWGYFVATIIYKNHAGAFFYLILAFAAALLLWHAQRGSRRLAKTSPAPVYGFCAVILATVVILSNSKGALLLMLGYLAVCLIGFAVWLCVGGRASGNRVQALVAGGLLVVFIVAGGHHLRLDKPFERVQTLIEQGENNVSVKSRLVVAKATAEMAEDKLWTGWGAGGFQHFFPVYQQNYAELQPKPRRKPQFWRHAHNDYLQGLSEYGIVGLLFPAAMLGWWLIRLGRLRVHRRPVILLAVGGLFLVMLHSWFDFQMQCPAVLVTWCAGWALTTRWAETERS
ncbi:MAG: O-antigen ligase family protein [Verrucomicrobiota bacterium]